MQYITEKQAIRLAADYIEDPAQKYIVYNIRRRNYLLHDYYKYFFRFSRRESVWNTPLFNIEDIASDLTNEETVAKEIFATINKTVDDTLSLKHKKEFSLDDCEVLLNYYFNGKTYIAFYDYYLGRVVLIKERDKSNDFGELIGSRYQLIGNLHTIINKSIELSDGLLESFMSELVNDFTPIREINGFEELNTTLHAYIVEEINKIDSWVKEEKAKA